jgi:hypothetical protein
MPGVDRSRDFIVLPGGHSSLVVARPFYARVRDFFDEAQPDVGTTSPAQVPEFAAE